MDQDHKCFNCGKAVDADTFCYGCKEHVCEDCEKNWNMPFGGHTKELHLVEP